MRLALSNSVNGVTLGTAFTVRVKQFRPREALPEASLVLISMVTCYVLR